MKIYQQLPVKQMLGVSWKRQWSQGYAQPGSFWIARASQQKHSSNHQYSSCHPNCCGKWRTNTGSKITEFKIGHSGLVCPWRTVCSVQLFNICLTPEKCCLFTSSMQEGEGISARRIKRRQWLLHSFQQSRGSIIKYSCIYGNFCFIHFAHPHPPKIFML